MAHPIEQMAYVWLLYTSEAADEKRGVGNGRTRIDRQKKHMKVHR